MNETAKELAIVTGASSGIGFQLAHQCARNGFDLLVTAADAGIQQAAETLRQMGTYVEALQTDLATQGGVEQLCNCLGSRPVTALVTQAGCAQARGFLDQDPADWIHAVESNITGTLLLIQKIGRSMRARGRGRILITGAIASGMHGNDQAVYSGTTAFLDSFSSSLAHELQESGVSVARVISSVGENKVLERKDMLHAKIGQALDDDFTEIAENAFGAMMRGDSGSHSDCNKNYQPSTTYTTCGVDPMELHRKMA